MDDAVIFIPEHHVITDMDVLIDLEHTCVFDLQIYLRSPVGTRQCLAMFDGAFFKGADYKQTIFDDEAAVAIEQGKPPFTGRFRLRAGSWLSVFDGQDAYGWWSVSIYDAIYYDTGMLNEVGLFITASAPEPNIAVLFAIGAGLIKLKLHR